MSKTKRDPVIDECWRAENIRNPEERRRILSPLWQEYVQGDKFQTTDLDRIEAITTAWAYLAVTEGNYRAAAEALDILFSHPQIDLMSPDIYAFRRSWLMGYLLQAGEERKALEVGRSLLALGQISRKTRAVFLSISLLFVKLLPSEELVSSSLTDFVWDMMQVNDKRLTKRRLPRQASNGELADALAVVLNWTEKRQPTQAELDEREANLQRAIEKYKRTHPEE